MPSRTIPEPTEEDRVVASSGVAHIMLRTEGDHVEAHKALVEVIAQQQAEIRFLRNIIHKGEQQ